MSKQERKTADTSKPENLTGTIETVNNSNDLILNDIGVYLEYIRENIKRIIENDGLKYSDPMDKKKIYPDFTYTQFLYLLSRLYDTVFSTNTELLYKYYYNNNNKLYDVDKVKKAYDVYYRLCQYYGYNCTIDPFYNMVGIDERTVKEWLSSGVSDLHKIMYENAKKGTVSRFENSPIPLLRLASANYKYNLDKPVSDHVQAGIIDTLPDLLALPNNKQELTDRGQE